jgi:hypothetical protein
VRDARRVRSLATEGVGRRRGSVFVLVLATLLSSSIALGQNDWTIVAGGPRDLQRIGPYYFARDAGLGHSYPGALRAFGSPSSRGADPTVPGVCTVRWVALGLDVRFSSPEGAADACSPARLRQSTWDGATAHARRWRTAKGLAVGDSVARLRSLYPRARYSDRPPAPPAWLLVFTPGETGPVVRLQAFVWDGRVTALDLPPGYASVRSSG